MDIDLVTQPLGQDTDGRDVFLRDVWPSADEVQAVIRDVISPDMFTRAYSDIFSGDSRWRQLDPPRGEQFAWQPESTYLRRPPYFDAMKPSPQPVTDIEGARVLALLGDSITTDHISPAGAIPAASSAGIYLTGLGQRQMQLNTYASRRGNHEVMMRGTFGNVQLRNRLVPGLRGGFTLCFAGTDPELPGAGRMPPVRTIYDAAMEYSTAETPLIVIGGALYGSGSSRDWAAKGPALLGVRAVVAESFERIHRSNLIHMGVLPLEFLPGDSASSLGLTGHEVIDIRGVGAAVHDSAVTTVSVHADSIVFRACVRLDTPRERDVYAAGGMLRFVLRRLQCEAASES